VLNSQVSEKTKASVGLEPFRRQACSSHEIRLERCRFYVLGVFVILRAIVARPPKNVINSESGKERRACQLVLLGTGDIALDDRRKRGKSNVAVFLLFLPPGRLREMTQQAKGTANISLGFILYSSFFDRVIPPV